jgi:hypothetical protein
VGQEEEGGSGDELFILIIKSNIICILIIYIVVKMAGEKVVPPKPEGQIKKEERDAKIANALKELRLKRREENKAKRAAATKRAQ